MEKTGKIENVNFHLLSMLLSGTTNVIKKKKEGMKTETKIQIKEINF